MSNFEQTSPVARALAPLLRDAAEEAERDVRVVPQHITVSSQWLEVSGGVLLGLTNELPFG